jgi:UDP-N-acetylglucosamine 4-epimerase
MYKAIYHNNNISEYNFLVTGGAGFIGSHIVEYLVQHKASKIVVLDNLSTGFIENIAHHLSLKNFEFINKDICDYNICLKATENIDFIIHQAALGSVSRSIEDPIATHNANANGFLNILNAARINKVKRIVYASSSSVYGDNETLPKKEENIGQPLSPYAVTKQINELYANVFTKIYDMELIGLRYFNIFGPRQSPKGPYAAVIPLFIQALLNNQAPIIFDDGNQSRDFTFVENAVQANIKAVFTNNPYAFGKVFNIAVGEKYSINNLFQTLKTLTNSNINPIYKEKRKGDISNSLADISKAKKYLDYNPQVKLYEGLQKTLEWFINNGKSK